MAPVDSTKVFTSYSNIEIKLIVHSFKLKSQTKVELDRKYPLNIFRDDHMRTQISAYIFSAQQKTLQDQLADKKFTLAAPCLTKNSNDKNSNNFWMALNNVDKKTCTQEGEFIGYQSMKNA